MTSLRSVMNCLDAITAPTPAQTWPASIDFPALKAKWAAEEAAENAAYHNELARRWKVRCAAVLGEAA